MDEGLFDSHDDAINTYRCKHGMGTLNLSCLLMSCGLGGSEMDGGMNGQEEDN